MRHGTCCVARGPSALLVPVGGSRVKSVSTPVWGGDEESCCSTLVAGTWPFGCTVVMLDERNVVRVRRGRAISNVVIFAVFAVTVGLIGLALDELLGQPSTNSLGQGLWFAGPDLLGVALTRLHPDGAGSLGLTLRFPGRRSLVRVRRVGLPPAGRADPGCPDRFRRGHDRPVGVSRANRRAWRSWTSCALVDNRLTLASKAL